MPDEPDTRPPLTKSAVTRLEERFSHLAREHEDLSRVVAAQADQIDRLTRAVTALSRRLSEAVDSLGDAPPADQKPPHW